MEEPWTTVVVVIHWIVAVLDVQAEELEPIAQERIKTAVEAEQVAAQGYFSLNLMAEGVEVERGVEGHRLGYLSNRLVFGPQSLGWEEDDQVQGPEETSHWHYLRPPLLADSPYST
jgi:hypothetical protein